MKSRNALLAAILPIVVAACDAPFLPGRLAEDVYDFSLPTQPPRILRWPAGAVVRVYVSPAQTATRAALLLDAFRAGAAAWNALAPYGEFRLAEAPSAATADVVLVWSDEIPPVETTGCPPVVTRAVTTFCLAPGGASLQPFPLRGQGAAPSPVRMIVTVLGSEAAVPDRVPRLVAHELGHVLGIARHSPNSDDLMWATTPQVSSPSRRDATTILLLYHVRPDVSP